MLYEQLQDEARHWQIMMYKQLLEQARSWEIMYEPLQDKARNWRNMLREQLLRKQRIGKSCCMSNCRRKQVVGISFCVSNSKRKQGHWQIILDEQLPKEAFCRQMIFMNNSKWKRGVGKSF